MRAHHPHRFLSREERDAIVAAIQEAQAKTSGEIRVHLDRRCKIDAEEAARRVFHRHGLHLLGEKHGVLIYLSPRDRKFAVIGDAGIHQKVEDGYWGRLRDRMRERFSKEEFGAGIVEAIQDVGARLAQAYPRKEAAR